MRPVAVLFARQDSIYKQLDGVDVWDQERDARKWPGGCPLIAHPPCRAWGRMHRQAKPRDGERELAIYAVDKVRTWGGVVEHPKVSGLWAACSIPEPGKVDAFGGWSIGVAQQAFGHRAEKLTILYIVGRPLGDVPPIPFSLDYADHVIAPTGRKGSQGWRPCVTKPEREQTPEAFAVWLVELARSCSRPGHDLVAG